MIPPGGDADACQRWREGSSCFRPAREIVRYEITDAGRAALAAYDAQRKELGL